MIARASRGWIVIVFAAIALSYAAAEVSGENGESYSELISEDSLDRLTEVRELEHRIGGDPDSVRLEVDCKLRSGTLSWQVVDPAGHVVWQDRATANSKTRIDETRPGLAGDWSLRLRFEEARGSYRIRLSAR